MDVVDPDDLPLTAETLAALQAGLFDDDTAARLRQRIRTDPEARQTMAALNAVRRDVAAVNAEPADPVDPAVVDRIAAGLGVPADDDAERSDEKERRRDTADDDAERSDTAHAISRGRLPRNARIAIATAGLAAIAVATWLGVSALLDDPAPLPSRPTTIDHITVSRPPLAIPLSDQQILELTTRPPDFGPLADPRRRASCLAGLGYSSNARVLGARPIDIAGHSGVLLVFSGNARDALVALVVAPTCSSANTGLSADRIVHRP